MAADDEDAGRHLVQSCKHRIEIAFGARMQDMQLQAKDTCCRLHATGIAGCCARVASGHAAVPAPSRVMNSRRLMGSLSPRVTPYHIVWEWALCITQWTDASP